MRQLYLLRHAKSDWDDPALPDLDRPLANRGRKAARLMAKYLRRADIRPAVVLCSPAKRAKETFSLIAPAFGKVSSVFDRRLYEADTQTLLACLATLPADTASALLIGHNPGLDRLAAYLTAERDNSDAAQRLRDKFPTCALAVLSTDADWPTMTAGCCRLDDFIRPADLDEAG